MTTGLGAIIGAGLGYLLTVVLWSEPPLVAAVSALVAGGLAGAVSYLVARRIRHLQNGSLLVSAEDGVFDALLVLAMTIGQIRGGIDRYDQLMAQDSNQQELQPVPLRLTTSPQDIEDELHRSMWDPATGESLDDPDDVIVEAAGVSDSVDAAISAAWAIRVRIRVHDNPPPTGGPDASAAFRPTVSNLRLLRQSLDNDTQTAAATSDELGRLNGYDQ